MSETPLTTYPVVESIEKNAHVSGFAAYEALVAEAEADHGAYWGRLAREFVAWRTPFTRTLDD
ncbi:MAG: hypothetical protein EOP73_12885, partial [Variovorax sp.]